MVCAVILACAFAFDITKRNDLAASRTRLTVSPMAQASRGEGCTGIITRSAKPMMALLALEMVGAVSIKQNAPLCFVSMVVRPASRSGRATMARSGDSASRRSCHLLSVACWSVSIIHAPASDAPA